MSRSNAERVFRREDEKPPCRVPNRGSAAGGNGRGFSPLHRDPQFSNRQLLPLLESGPSHRKQMVRPRSNRKFAIRRGSQSRATNGSRGICSNPERIRRLFGGGAEGSARNRKLLDTPRRVIFGLTHSKQRIGAAIKCHTFRGS